MTGAPPGRLDRWATAEAFGSGVVARDAVRDVVVVRGPDAGSFLQGQCTQDLSGLEPGGVADALVLSVQGKVVALVRCWRRTADELVLETAAGYGEALAERLRRFKIRVKVELEWASWPLVEVRGPDATALAEPGGFGIAVPTRSGWPSLDLLGEATGLADGVARGDEATFEAARCEAGLPAMGSELDEGTIPYEAGMVEWTVSFTKGCYTGQELVARLDARGARVPRVLRGVVGPGAVGPGAGEGGAGEGGAGGSGPAVGWVLADGERDVGRVTSAAFSPFRDATVALAYVRREVDPPAVLTARPADGEPGEPVRVRIEQLPLRRAAPG